MRAARRGRAPAAAAGSLALVALAALAAAACSGSPASEASAAGGATGAPAGELVVLAAASLTDAFARIGDAFEDAHPDVTAQLGFGASSTLATQIEQGAPADVFASAGARQVEQLAAGDLVAGDAVPFAGNALVIAVERGNPLGIDALEDLARDDVVLVLPAPEVPAGELAAEVLEGAGVEAAPSSLEPDVRATLARVELGEADAAIVYATDVRSTDGAVEAVAIPDDANRTTTYPAVVLRDAPNPDAATAFVTALLEEPAQQILRELGFRPAAP